MTMVVKINGVQETEVLNYIIVWEMNEIGSCLIILDDTGGGSSAKYTPEAYAFEDIVIEYPSGTAIWKGRIRKIEYLDDMVVLHGEDWLGQYKDQVTSKDNIWDESGDIEAVDYTDDWIQDTDKSWADDAFDGMQLIIKASGSGTRNNIIYSSEFEMTGMSYDGGDLEKTRVNDWNGVLNDRATYALCSKSGTVLPTVELTLIAKTTATKADVLTSGVGINVAAHVRGGDYGNSYLQVYNWNTDVWDNLGTGDCNHNFEQDYGWNSKNYLSDDGYVYVKLKATATDQQKYLIFDFLKITIRHSATFQPTVFTIASTGGGNKLWLDEDIENPDILVGDNYKICRFIKKHLVDDAPLFTAFDYQQTLTVNSAGNNKVTLTDWKYAPAWDVIKMLAREDQRDIFLKHSNLNLYYGKYIETTKAIELSQTCPILQRSVSCDGDKLINKAIVRGNGVTGSRTDTASKEEYNNTWKTFTYKDDSIDFAFIARDLADSIVARYSKLKKHPIITIAGLADYDVGEIVTVKLSNQDVEDHYITRKKAFDYQKYETLLELVPIRQLPTKKHDIVWDKIQDVDRRLSRLELRAT